MDSDDELLAEVAENLERQLTYQEQIGGNAVAREPGRFEFTLSPYVDRASERLGVPERHYTANLRQRGQFIEHQHLTPALSDAIYTSLQNLIRHEQINPWSRLSLFQFGE